MALQARHVIRYVCPFCHRGHSKVSAGERHLSRCWRNPAAHGCKTCASYQPAEKAEYHPYGYPGCAEGCDAGLTVPRAGCELWERKQ